MKTNAEMTQYLETEIKAIMPLIENDLMLDIKRLESLEKQVSDLTEAVKDHEKNQMNAYLEQARFEGMARFISFIGLPIAIYVNYLIANAFDLIENNDIGAGLLIGGLLVASFALGALFIYLIYLIYKGIVSLKKAPEVLLEADTFKDQIYFMHRELLTYLHLRGAIMNSIELDFEPETFDALIIDIKEKGTDFMIYTDKDLAFIVQNHEDFKIHDKVSLFFSMIINDEQILENTASIDRVYNYRSHKFTNVFFDVYNARHYYNVLRGGHSYE